ncbi:hypothetical protein EAI_05754, partial [Harpegnathos saltator]
IHKWDCKFTGKDPLNFLERIDELRICYGLSTRQLFWGIPQMLRGDPLLWYRNHRPNWHTWEDFCQAFREQYLLPRHRAEMRRQIAERRQRPHETYREYENALLTLIRR